MKRSKQMQVMVDTFNTYAKNNFVSSTSDIAYLVITAGLLQANCYKGFNYMFKDGTLGTADHCDYIHVY